MPHRLINITDSLSLLYELALNLGKTFDPQQECKTFLNTLVSRKNLESAAIWINPEFQKKTSEFSARLIYSLPGSDLFRTELEKLNYVDSYALVEADKHSLFINQLFKNPRSFASEHKGALFRVGKLGYLFISSLNKPNGFPKPELNQLRDIIQKLATTLEACFLYQQNQQEIHIRKKREEELGLLRELFMHSRDAVTISNETGEFVFANKEAIARFSGSEEELLQRKVWELEAFFEGQEEQWKKHLTLLRKEKNLLVEGEHLSKNGHRTPVEVSIRYTTLGDQSYIIGFSRDITERVESRAKLEEQSRHIEELARFPNENPDPVLRFSSEGKLLFSNHSGSIFYQRLNAEQKEIFFGRLKEAFLQENYSAVELKSGLKYFDCTFFPVISEGYVNVYARDITEKRRIEGQLKQLSLVASKTDNGVLITDHHGKITWANESFLRVSGYSLNELIDHRPGELLQGPDTLEEDKEAFRKGLASQKPFQVEILNYHRSGTPYWVSCSITPVFSSDGKLERFIALQVDITQKKAYEDQLKAVNSRLETLISSLNEGILVETELRELALINQSACDFFQIPSSPAEMIGMDCALAAEISKPLFADPDGFIKRVEELLENKHKVVNEEIALADGRIVERDYIPIFIEGQYSGHLWRYKDISERKKVEMEMLKREKFLKLNLLQQQILSNISYELNQHHRSFKDKISQTLGKVGKFLNVSRVYIFEDDPEGETTSNTFEWCNSNISPQIDDLQGIPYEIIPSFKPLLDKKGRIFSTSISELPADIYAILEPQGILSVLIYPIYQEGQIMGFIGFDECNQIRQWDPGTVELLRTVSNLVANEYQRKANAENLLRSQKEALEAAKTKEAFLANMSHEIRTPMNAILGMSHLLEQTSLNGKQSSYLGAIKTSADNLLVVLNDILDFSKIQAGKLSLEHIPFSLEDVTRKAIKTQALKAAEKNILLECDYQRGIYPAFWGDPFRLNQVLLNLLSNAIKFTSEGKIKLSCQVLSVEDETQQIEIAVADTGIGIPEEKLDKIFESFQQSDESVSRKYGGTGLGLTITQELIQLFNGQIRVQSTLGKGSTFYVILTLKKADPSLLTPAPSSNAQELDLKGRSVLLAEDHELNQFLALSILENWGMKVEIANNGKEAIEKLKEQPYDLVLMDIQMPELNGMDATEKIRKELQLDVPVIALTANALKGDKERFLSAGMNDYVAKPFEPQKFYHVICKNLNITPMKNPETKGEKSPLSTAPSSLYSLEKLRQLSGGNEEFVSKMVRLFVENTPQSMKELKDAFALKSHQKIREVAHKMKPSVDTILLAEGASLIREIEQKAKEEVTFSELKPLVDQMISLLEEVLADLA